MRQYIKHKHSYLQAKKYNIFSAVARKNMLTNPHNSKKSKKQFKFNKSGGMCRYSVILITFDHLIFQFIGKEEELKK